MLAEREARREEREIEREDRRERAQRDREDRRAAEERDRERDRRRDEEMRAERAQAATHQYMLMAMMFTGKMPTQFPGMPGLGTPEKPA